MEGLSALRGLKVLDLSFNRITALQNIESLYNLEVLEMGKNFIASADNLGSKANPLIYL